MKINKFYVGAEHIAAAIEQGYNDPHTHATLGAAIEHAKNYLEDDSRRESVIIVEIVRVVRRASRPVVVEIVK